MAILGYPYQGGKTLLIILTLGLLFYVSASDELFIVTTKIEGLDGTKVEIKTSVGAFITDIDDKLKNDDDNKRWVTNKAKLGCFINELDDEKLMDCGLLQTMETTTTVIITLLLLGLIPKYGEASEILGGTLIVGLSIGLIIYAHDKIQDTRDGLIQGLMIQQLGPVDGLLAYEENKDDIIKFDDDCITDETAALLGIKKGCMPASWGGAFWANIALMVLGFVILAQSGVGLFSQFCD